MRKLRQAPPLFGVARVAEIVPDPEGLEETTVALARRIGLRGIASAEFKRDARDGRFRFIELNGRSVVYNGLLRRAGLDLAVARLDRPRRRRAGAGRGRTAGPASGSTCTPTCCTRRSTAGADRPGLAEFLAPYRRPKLEAVWSASDPLPFVAQWTRTARGRARARRRGTASSSPTVPGRRSRADRQTVTAARSSDATARNFPSGAQLELAPPPRVDHGAGAEQALELRQRAGGDALERRARRASPA